MLINKMNRYLDTLIGFCVLLSLFTLFMTTVFAIQKRKTPVFEEEVSFDAQELCTLDKIQQVFVVSSKDSFDNFVKDWPYSNAINLKSVPLLDEESIREQGNQRLSVKTLMASFQSSVIPIHKFSQFASHVSIWQDLATQPSLSAIRAIFDTSVWSHSVKSFQTPMGACERPYFGMVCGDGFYLINGHMARYFLQQLQGSMAKDFMQLDLFCLETLRDNKDIIQIDDFRALCNGTRITESPDDLRKMIKKIDLGSINQA